MNSKSITFRRGAFLGWNVAIYGITEGGQTVRIVTQLETTLIGGKRRSGLLNFGPETPGWDVMVAALEAGMGKNVAALEAALVWVVEATREALGRRTDIDAEHREHWQTVVDAADRSLNDFFARYPDARVPAFELLGALVVSA